MDVSDIIEYNVGLLNSSDLTNSFFCLLKDDPTAGFAFDASRVAGQTYPETPNHTSGKLCMLYPATYDGVDLSPFDSLIDSLASHKTAMLCACPVFWVLMGL